MHRSRITKFGAMTLLIMSLVAPSAAAAGEGQDAPDFMIVSSARQLSDEEVRAHDITDSETGANALRVASEDGSIDVNRRPYRVFDFNGQRVVIDAKTPVTASVGLNEAGEEVYDVVPLRKPVPAGARPGYAVPPSSAWTYNTDGSFVTYLGT